jgi:hypothetical protein
MHPSSKWEKFPNNCLPHPVKEGLVRVNAGDDEPRNGCVESGGAAGDKVPPVATEDVVLPPPHVSCRVPEEKTMRSLKVEELSLVAGATCSPTPQCKDERGNNGLGNGDQAAPGSSLENNGAENNTGGNTTGNPPGSGNFPVVPN